MDIITSQTLKICGTSLSLHTTMSEGTVYRTEALARVQGPERSEGPDPDQTRRRRRRRRRSAGRGRRGGRLGLGLNSEASLVDSCCGLLGAGGTLASHGHGGRRPRRPGPGRRRHSSLWLLRSVRLLRGRRALGLDVAGHEFAALDAAASGTRQRRRRPAASCSSEAKATGRRGPWREKTGLLEGMTWKGSSTVFSTLDSSIFP